MITLDEALGIIDATLAGYPVQTRRIPVREAVNCITAETLASRVNMPPFDKSLVDGYALPEGEEQDEYQVTGTIAAGEAAIPLSPGTAIKIMTGSPIPAGTGSVVKVEHTRQEQDHIRILQRDPVPNIGRTGQDVKMGDVVLEKGARLDALRIASIIGAGIDEVLVAAPVKLFILSTGNEIVESYGELQENKIINMNGPLLENLAREYNLTVVGHEIVPDDYNVLKQHVEYALDTADMVILSGGVSMGDYDFVPDVLREIGLTIRFHKVAIKPGKPGLFAADKNKVVFGLPGNPMAVYLGFHIFALRAALHMAGGAPQLRKIRLPLASEFKRKMADRLEFVPCRISHEGTLQTVRYAGSSHLASMTAADGFFLAPLGVSRLESGTITEFIPIKGLV